MKIKKLKNFDMKKTILTISILSLLFGSCKVNTSGQYNYQSPEQIWDNL